MESSHCSLLSMMVTLIVILVLPSRQPMLIRQHLTAIITLRLSQTAPPMHHFRRVPTHPFSWHFLPTTIVVQERLLLTTSRSRLQHPIALQLLSMTPARLMRTVRSMLQQAACSAMTQMLMRTHFRSQLSELEQKLDLGLQAHCPRRSQAPMVT